MVSMAVDESKISAFWSSKKIYEKARALRRGGKKFYFLDGPPYASGYIHMGTGLNKILKDAFIRFWRARGFDVWDQPGYDTHGLPIEKKIEQQLGLTSKAQIEKLGIDKFNEKCRKFATQFIDAMNNEFADLGVWMDWSNPYLTLTNDYIESAWATFKIAFDKGLLYRGLYPVHICPSCETAVAYNEIIYDKMADPSIYVKFQIAGKKHEYLLIWTTTPWTLVANTGVMVNPNAEYVKIVVGSESMIVARPLVDAVMQKVGKDFKIVGTMRGKELEGLRYVHPLAHMIPYAEEIAKDGYRVVLSEQFVSMTDGSGLVHTAPGHGQEDYKVGIETKLPIVCHVKLDGRFDDAIPALKGKPARETNGMILEELVMHNALLYTEKIVHDYPRCWRCESPLLLIAVPQWFFRVTTIRDKLLAENEKTRWVPAWAGARFRNWLEGLGDWPISRQRYWGIPLPIWMCENNHIRVVGSADELGKKLSDLHRPYVDDIQLDCKECHLKMKRVPDVLDVWFDSGLCSWASLGWPKKKEAFERLWPADLNIEGPDQIRGWWNSQLITSMITFGRAPFKTILFHGFALDAHGVKMSKSKGNVTNPADVIKKYPRDVLRLYLLSSPAWNDYYFNWKDVDAVAKSYMIIYNTFNFIQNYVPRVPKEQPNLLPEDCWLLSRLSTLVKSVTDSFENYCAHKAVEELQSFIINELSRTYIKLVRDRVWPAYGGDDAAFYTLYTAAKTLSRLLAPITPFLAEDIHQKVLRPLGESAESVHLCDWPRIDERAISKELEADMALALRIVEAANALRSKAKVKLRQPLRTLVIGGDAAKRAVATYSKVIGQLANVKEVQFGHAKWQHEQPDFKLWLDTELDAELRREGAVRELVRHIQEQRKANRMVVTDRINLSITGLDVHGFEDKIKAEVGAVQIMTDKLTGKASKLEVDGKTVEVGIEVAKAAEAKKAAKSRKKQ